MPDMDPRRMNPEEAREAAESARAFLNALEAQKEDARDNELIWVENPSGRRDVCKFGYWRKHLSRQTNKGWRMLTPEEIADEQEKVAQADAERREKQRLWRKLPPRERHDEAGWQDYTLEDLQRLIEERGYEDRDPNADLNYEELQAKIAKLEEELLGEDSPKAAA